MRIFDSCVTFHVLSCCYTMFLFLLQGKYHAVKAGEARSKEFCKTNLIPMALFAYASYSVGAWDTLVWVGFTAGYAYCGFM